MRSTLVTCGRELVSRLIFIFSNKVTTIPNHHAVHFHAHHGVFEVTVGYSASPTLLFVKLLEPSSRAVTAGFHSI